jgi:hypothetical protein
MQLTAQGGAGPVPVHVNENLLNMTATTMNFLLDNSTESTGALAFETYMNEAFETAFPGQGEVRTLAGLATDQAEMANLLSKKAEMVSEKWQANQKMLCCKQEWENLKVAAEAASQQERAQQQPGAPAAIMPAGFGFSGASFGSFGAQAAQPAQAQLQQPTAHPQLAWSGGAAPPAGDGTIYSDDDGFDEETEADKAFIDGDGDDDDADSDYEDDLSARLHSTGV